MTTFSESLPKNFNVTPDFVTKLGYERMVEHGIEGWSIVWNKNTSRFGVCKYSKKQIGLSAYLFDKLDDRRNMVDTVLHEIAHILAEGDGHGYLWKRKCILVGANPLRANHSKTTTETETDKKYSMTCSVHGHQHGFSRKPKRKYSCTECSPRWSDKHVLKVVRNW